MKLVKPSFKILSVIDSPYILKSIEKIGRTCYKSEDKITEDSAMEFVRMIIKRGHLSVIEHQSISVKFIVDRGVSHELVRHRLASFSQESTRYCNYSKDKFDNQLTFIVPCWIEEFIIKEWDGHIKIPTDTPEMTWLRDMNRAEMDYNKLILWGWTPQQARSVLPNSLKTEIVVTANLREWRLILQQRTSENAHPQMREVMCPLLEQFKFQLPVIFDDINYE